MEEILRVEGLKKVFGSDKKKDVIAVDGVSFSIREGETVSIVGESGSGKTTLARMVTRLESSSQGKIFLCGEDITHSKGRELKNAYRKMQMVFQSPVDSFDPRRSLGDGITEGLKNFGVSKKEADRKAVEILGACGLKRDLLKRYPHEVSGGQCQRAAIARALLLEPKLLILDEATSALDVTVQKEIVDLLDEVKKKTGISYLMISHDIALSQNISDRILVMYGGKIVEEGDADQVICDPQADYTKKLIDSVL